MRTSLLFALLALTACRTVDSYSDFRADFHDVTAIAVSVGTRSGGYEPAISGAGPASRTVQVGEYEVRIQRGAGSITYEARASSGRIVTSSDERKNYESGTIVGASEVPLLLDPAVVLAGRPGGMLTWKDRKPLATFGYETHSDGFSYNESSMSLELGTAWDNVDRVVATEHASRAMRWLGYGGALATYLAGGLMLTAQYANRNSASGVSKGQVVIGLVLVGAGFALLPLGRANEDYDVVVYGRGKGEKVGTPQQDSSEGTCMSCFGF